MKSLSMLTTVESDISRPATSSNATTSHVPSRPTRPVRHVDEKLGDGDLAARDQDRVGGRLSVDERLAGTPRTELDEVVVPLGHRDEPGERRGACPRRSYSLGSRPIERMTRSSHVVAAERASTLEVLIDVEGGDLDGLESA